MIAYVYRSTVIWYEPQTDSKYPWKIWHDSFIPTRFTMYLFETTYDAEIYIDEVLSQLEENFHGSEDSPFT